MRGEKLPSPLYVPAQHCQQEGLAVLLGFDELEMFDELFDEFSLLLPLLGGTQVEGVLPSHEW